MSDAETPHERDLPQLHVRADPMLVIATAAALYALHETAAVCVPVLVSVLAAYALEPFVAALGRCRVPRIAGAVIVYAIVGVMLAAVARGVRSQTASFLDNLPRTVAEIEHAVEDGRRRHDHEPGILERLRRASEADQRAAARKTAAPPASGASAWSRRNSTFARTSCAVCAAPSTSASAPASCRC